MFSHETEKNVMIGTGIALEYTRDSPLFRQQLNAIEESYHGISGYVDGSEFDLLNYFPFYLFTQDIHCFARCMR